MAASSQGHGVCRQWPGTQSAHLIKALHNLERWALTVLRSGHEETNDQSAKSLLRLPGLLTVASLPSAHLGNGVAILHRELTVALCGNPV